MLVLMKNESGLGFMIMHRKLKVMRRLGTLSLAVLSMLILSATAQANSPQPSLAADPIQSVVAKQLSAFKERDSAQAYAVISQSFRSKYQTPLRFATMMRLNFWNLYNHATYRFLGQNHNGSSEIQKVEVTGDDLVRRIYLFRMTKGESGDWLIDNVLMLDPEGQAI